MKKDITILDLFSGIGGFSKGFQDAGFNIEKHYFSEIDKHAIAVYKDNFKNSIYAGSVDTIQSGNIERPNIITFGSPCQDFSLAGKRKGLDGERSSLILHAIRLISDLRPDFFIWENVKGAFSSNDGADFWAILQAFANIGGYRLEWQLLNTKWFLPQNRERIYLIGHLATARGSFKPVFPIGEEIELHHKIEQEKPSQIASTLNANDEKSWVGNFIQVKSATSQGYEEATDGDSINLSNPNSETRRGRVGKGVAQTLDCACNQAVMIGAFRGRNPENPKSRKSGLPTEQMLEINQDGVSNTLTSVQKDNVVVKIGDIRYDAGGFRERKNGIAPTITSGSKNSGTPNCSVIKYNQNIRRLTEIECEKLQGFPPNWTQFGNYDGVIKEVPKTQRYKMLGNAVTVRVVEEIAKRLID